MKKSMTKTPSSMTKMPNGGNPAAKTGKPMAITNNKSVSDEHELAGDNVSHVHRDPSKGNHANGDFTNKF